MTIRDKNHLRHLVTNGIYYGYSNDSILEFVQNFGLHYGYSQWNEQRQAAKNISGHLFTWTERLLYTEEELFAKVNERRFCHVSFPSDDCHSNEMHILELKETSPLFNELVERMYNICLPYFPLLK